MFYRALWDSGQPCVQWGVVIGASLVAAVCDLARRRIPNWLTLPLLAGGAAWAGWTAGWGGLCDSLAACVILAAPYLVLFLAAGGGAGDVKLMAGIGSWLGVIAGTVALAAVAASGIVLALVSAATGRRLPAVLRNVAVWFLVAAETVRGRGRTVRFSDLPAHSRMQTVPYGAAILVGACIAAGGVFLWRR